MNINENKAIEANEPELLNITIDQMEAICARMGVDTDEYAALIQEMYWDGHSPFEIKQQIEVLEGDCSI
tara:strand:+ start:916 stop:1122 length:207 start_codon:yes stop_codon:yes gene_type:complete